MQVDRDWRGASLGTNLPYRTSHGAKGPPETSGRDGQERAAERS